MGFHRPLFRIIILTLLLLLSPVWAAKILLVFPYDTASQCKLLTPYLEALMGRGHQLTLIHGFPDCKILPHLHSLHVKDRYNTTCDFTVFESSKWSEMISIRNFIIKISLNVLENEKVQQLLHSNTTYDLVIVEPSNTDALFGLAAHFNASLMGLATSGGDWNLDTLVGYAATLEPILPIGYRRGFSLLDRLYNWVFISEEWMLQKLIFLPKLRAVHRHYFGHLPQRFAEVRHSFSLILLNQHFSLFEARPNVPSMVEVGGMHVPKKLPRLPHKLARFIAEAEHGVIYMSLGLEMQSKDLPKATLELIHETFEALPQRIIWKFEGVAPFNVSNSIYMDKWLPQQEILSHPNVKLIITHGGMLSIIEAAHYAKPVLGMPLFFDQFRNVERMQIEGVALLLDINTLSRQSFEAAVRQLLEQPQYAHKAKALSDRFRDQLVHPLDMAVYWTEYVLRYKGAPHMRISASNLKFLDYYGLDNLLMVFGRLALIIILVWLAFSHLRRSLERSFTLAIYHN